jgi:hypothetical protein
MRKKDILFFFLLILFFLPFFLFPEVYRYYREFNLHHGMLMAFIKFALLASLGEVIGLRIRKGVYFEKTFGLVSRMIVWGFLGLSIKMAFIIFAAGTPVFLAYMGFKSAPQLMHADLSWAKLGVAFSISLSMNLIYAPIMMTLHKITDHHIQIQGGSLGGFFQPIKVGMAFKEMDWDVMWNFVFKKTIPFFWIPAHTITFLLPPDFQVLFAAILGIALGTILAVAELFKN